MKGNSEFSRGIYPGLFLVSLSVLAYEIVLTRIFSVTMWYHFAFMSISIVMFGMTFGAILVYLFPGYFSSDKTFYHLSLSAFLFSAGMVITFVLYLYIPFIKSVSVFAFLVLSLTYLIISIPFVFSGICVCLSLTRFPERVGRLYCADLFGAGIGCIFVVYVLRVIDAPSAVLLIAFISGAGALLFSGSLKRRLLLNSILIFDILLLGLISINVVLAKKHKPLIGLVWVKGNLVQDVPVYERWNSFSYIRITGSTEVPTKVFGWGLSDEYPEESKKRQLFLTIDGSALTPITGFKGDFKEIDHLRYDITNLVHYIRRNADVLIIGAGGGRDIISALLFGQKSITALELNSDIIKALNDRFGDFSGHLDSIEGVRFINDEARSWIRRSKEKFDVIQISLIDTWASTSAGAYILAEHSLYTVEAFRDFFSHLNPSGVLSFTYWYSPKDSPVAIYRIVSIARESLIELRESDVRRHILIFRKMYKIPKGELPAGVATVLISRKPFSEEDIEGLEEVSREMKFELVLSPEYTIDGSFVSVISGRGLGKHFRKYPLNIKPTRDDSPFFFYVLKMSDAFNPRNWGEVARVSGTGPLIAVFIIAVLVVITIFLTFLFIIVPLILTTRKGVLKGSLPLFLFFTGIGFGYMMIEISQMQRLIIFLGHPTYGLSVVLFSLLLSSGFGSFLTQIVRESSLKRHGIALISILLLSLIIFGILTPFLSNVFRASSTFVRILVSVLMLFPIGIFMGMPFPLGMKLCSKRKNFLMPWLFGINGAVSVLASVIAVVIALNSNISSVLWTGFLFYTLALISFIRASQNWQ